MNAVHNPTRLAGHDGREPWLQSLRLEPGQGARRGPFGTVAGDRESARIRHGWPGKGLGIRPPGPDETPLSRAEVRYAGGRVRLWEGVR